MRQADAPALWIVPVLAFVAAALVTSALRDARPHPGAKSHTAMTAREHRDSVATPSLADVADLPAPLAALTPRRIGIRPSPPVAPAPQATTAPARTVAPTSSAQPAPIAAPAPAPRPPAAPRPTPAPTFDDSGSGVQFDDRGPSL